MTKQHFVALADAFRASRPQGIGESFWQWNRDVEHVANVCHHFNGKFDKHRFISHVLNTEILT